LKLYGQEYIADTWAMANMNLGEHGGDNTGPKGTTPDSQELQSTL